MVNTHITANQYEELLKRIEKVEHREVAVDELKEEYHNIKKDVAVMDTKFDNKLETLRVEMNERFNSLEKRFAMMWALQVATFLAILALLLKDIILG